MTKSQQNRLKQVGEQLARRSINFVILSGIRRYCLRSGKSRSLYLSITRAIEQRHVTFGNYIQKFIQHPAVKVNSQNKLMGIISVDFNATSHLLIKYSAFVKYQRKNGNTMKQCISYL
jgi:hypothetical protein